MERVGVCPSSNAEEDLQMTVLLLQLVDGFEVAVEICADVIPGVTGVVNVLVCPRVG